MAHFRSCAKLLFVTVLFGGTAASAQTSIQFEAMGFISSTYPGRYVLAYAVSDNGLVAVGMCKTGPPFHVAAFRWTHDTGMQELPFTEATAVSADGGVVVGYKTTGPSTAVAIRWTAATGAVQLGYLSGGNLSVAQGVSNDGTVVVGTSNSTASLYYGQPFRWTASSGLVSLGTINGGTGIQSYCNGLSDDGAIAVGSTPNGSGFQESFRWGTETGMQGLGSSGLGSNGAYAVSADGSVVVGRNVQDGFSSCAFRWTNATGMYTLGDCGSANVARTVSADGEIIGGTYGLAGSSPAFIWDAARGWRNIQQIISASIPEIADWYIDGVTGVSADGQTWVGYSYDPAGYSQGWIAFIPRPLPCPADVNGDRFVDLSDVALMLSAFGATPSNSNYSLACDIDRNGVVELGELASVLAVYGNACP